MVYCAQEGLRALQERGLDIISIHSDFELAAVVATSDPRQFAPYDTDSASSSRLRTPIPRPGRIRMYSRPTALS